MTVLTMVMLMVSGIVMGSLYTVMYDRHQDAKAGRIASWVSSITEAYADKIIEEESEDGFNFEGLALTNGATLTYTGQDLINNLLSDGSSGDPNHPACDDGTGVYGLSRRGYLRCDFQNYIPYSGGSRYQATFTRTAPANPAPNYTIGYSQISGTFTFGSTPGNPFSLDGIVEDPKLAKKVIDKLSARVPQNNTNLVLASVIDYRLTRAGELQAIIDLRRNSEIAIRSDGATVFTQDQSLGDNSLTDVKSLIWGTVDSELMENGSLGLNGGSTGTDASSIYFDKTDQTDNYVRLTSSGLSIMADAVDILNDLGIGGDLTLDGDLIIPGSGVSIKKIPQTIGLVENGGVVTFPTCVTEGNERLIPIPIVNIPDPDHTNALAGFYPEIETKDGYWQVYMKNLTEEGSTIPVGPDSRIGVIAFCEE